MSSSSRSTVSRSAFVVHKTQRAAPASAYAASSSGVPMPKKKTVTGRSRPCSRAEATNELTRSTIPGACIGPQPSP